MGKIRVTKAGYLYFDFFYEGRRCREYSELKNTPDNLKRMNSALKKIDSDIKLGIFDYSKYFPGSGNIIAKTTTINNVTGSPSFEKYALDWYENTKIMWKPSVQNDFYSIMNCHLIPYFKEYGVKDMTKWMIKEFRTYLAGQKGRKEEKISNKRINNIILVLRLILNDASERFDFPSPFLNFKPLPIRKPDIMPLSLDEVLKFLENVNKAFYNYYVIRFFTGMRTAEIDGLKWQYVDFANKKILVRMTWQNKRWVTPKTQTSVRDIDMSKIVEKALLSQKEMTGNNELVFRTKEGRPLDYNNVSKRIWYPTLKQAGLIRRNPYQTRHTAATLWLGSGENPEWVARQLGHANTEMLFKVYSKFIPNLTRNDGSAFEKFFTEKMEEQNNSKKDDLVIDEGR